MRYGEHWSSEPVERGVYSSPLKNLQIFSLMRTSIQDYFAKKFTTGDSSNYNFIQSLKSFELNSSYQSNFCLSWLEGSYAEADQATSKKCILCQDVRMNYLGFLTARFSATATFTYKAPTNPGRVCQRYSCPSRG